MKSKISFTYFVLFMFSLNLNAQVFGSDWIKLQDHFQKQAEKVMSVYDDESKVIVQVVALPESEILPGTTLDEQSSHSSKEDIDRVNITIFTKKSDFDSSLKESFGYALNLSANKIRINFKKSYIVEKVQPKSPYDGIKEFQAATEANFEKFMKFLVFSVSGLGMLILILGIFDFVAKRNGFKTLAQGLQSAAQNATGALQTSMPMRSKDLDFDHSDVSRGSHLISSAPSSAKIRLSTEGLLAFFSDCYWTENDSWAHRAWLTISTDQKKLLLNALEYFNEYVRHFSQIEPEPWNENAPWNDVHYLNPLSFEAVSQKDLWKLIQTDKQYWWNISKMRQSALALSLKERLDLLNIKKVQKNVPPNLKSSHRILAAQLQISVLNLEDESFLMNNLKSIAPNLRKELPSLVWLRLLPEIEVRKLFEKLDAKTISQSLVGPKEFAEWVVQFIPEKKLALVQSYQTKISVDRNGYSFLYVFQTILKILGEVEQANQHAPSKSATKVA